MKTISLLLLVIFSCSFMKSDSARINFYNGSYDNLLRKAKKEHRNIYLEFTAEWCVGCKKMNKETYSSPEIIDYLNKNFLVYKVDVDNFDGMDIAERFSIKSYPTSVILNEKGKQAGQLPGFYPPGYLKVEIAGIMNQSKTRSYAYSRNK